MLCDRIFRFAVGAVFLLTESGCGTSASPSLRDSMIPIDATVDVGNDAEMDVDAIAPADGVDVSEEEAIVADTVDAGSVDVLDAASVPDRVDASDALVGRDVADVPPTDAECTPNTATRQCRIVLGITQDPEALFQCCDGRCSSSGCGPGGGCGGMPCNAQAGEICCPRRFFHAVHCVPRDQGLCTYTP